MAIVSNLAVLSDAQAITADDTASTNYIDTGVTTPQGQVNGKNAWLCIRTNTAPTDAGDSIGIELQCDDNSSFTSPKVALALYTETGSEITVSDGRFDTAGDWVLRCSVPFECNERYWRLMYRNTTSNGTITLDAWVQDVPPERGTQVTTSPVGNPSVV